MSATRELSRGWTGLCFFAIAAVGLIIYHPSLNVGFWTDDYSFIDAAGRLDFADYLVSYFDPRQQWHWFRPMQGLQWWLGYQFFQGNAAGHHLIQVGLHILNACLLFDLTRAVTRRWRLALLAALIYATLSVDSLAVTWVGVADPLVSVFFLFTLRCWFNYLTGGCRRWLGVTWFALSGALMSKEVAAVLPITLFLMDGLLVARPASLNELIKRYAPFVLALAIYGALEWNVLTRGLFTTHLGYGAGSHIFVALAQHLTTLAFPWGLPFPANYIWLACVSAMLVFALFKRERRTLFLVAVTLLALAPILPFQFNMASSPRYLYLPLMGSAIGIAVFLESLPRLLAHRRWLSFLSLTISAGLVFWNGAAIADSTLNFEGVARQMRLQFRPIFEAHPTFPPDTFLYFVNPPMESPYISGLMLLRYGKTVSVGGIDVDRRASLREHQAAWIFYQDDAKQWQSFPVTRDVSARVAPGLPAQFAGLIALDEFELARDRIEQGDALAAIVSWRALARIDKDYTIFAHLVNARGEIVASADSPPRQGNFPTSAWRQDARVFDGLIIPIGLDLPPGEYQLQIGLYELATMQRLAVIDATGQAESDSITISPIWIGE